MYATCRRGPGGSACCYWNRYGTLWHHPARRTDRKRGGLVTRPDRAVGIEMLFDRAEKTRDLL